MCASLETLRFRNHWLCFFLYELCLNFLPTRKFCSWVFNVFLINMMNFHKLYYDAFCAIL